MHKKVLVSISTALASLALASCIIHRVDVIPVDVTAETPISIETPVKAHLHDGSTVVYPDGVDIHDGRVRGRGERFDVALRNMQVVESIQLDDVAAMESFQTPVNTGATAAASTAGTVAWIFVGSLVAVALFGSCPTVYSLEAGNELLEAELFSYSIAPSFQARDVDKLGISSLADGKVQLDIRNEMLETHYIDHLEVIEIEHGPAQKVFPDEDGRPLVVDNLIPPSKATDMHSGDILDQISSVDEKAWSASDERLANVTRDDYLTHLDFEFGIPPANGDLALVLRMRNSLLNTVLFYDVMLRQQSFGALDWMGHDLNHLGNRAELGLWYKKHMGMTVSVWRNGVYKRVSRIGDQGPIAWSERAVRIPASGNGPVKVRLSFVADNWRIDQVSLALDSDYGKTRVVPVSEARTADGVRSDIPAFLKKADKEYLITRPGDNVQLAFDVGKATGHRTWFLASEGYYMEWMRSDWLTEEHRRKFEPSVDAILNAIESYAAQRDGLRSRFEAVKVPVR